MKQPRSRFLKAVLSQIGMARVSLENPGLDVDTIVAFKNADAMTRRTFLTDVAKTSLLAGLFGSSTLASASRAASRTDGPVQGTARPARTGQTVAIVGGGIAGLNAAHHLSRAGIVATLFEGSGRVGGRILTHYNDALEMDIHPEFGGDFIDTDHQDMRDLAREFGLELIDIRAEAAAAHLTFETYFFDGRHIPEREIVTAFRKIAAQLAADRTSLGENYDTAAGRALDAMPLATYIGGLKCESWLKDILTAAFIAEYGLDTSEQSTINLLSMIATDTTHGFEVFGSSDERFRIKGGNSRLTVALAEELQDAIITNHMLTAIARRDGRYVLSFQRQPDVRADYVILTIPFTMLRNVRMDLSDMTAAKRRAIGELGYGQANKLFLGYQRRPWREGASKYNGYLFHQDIHNGWDATTTEFSPNDTGAYCCFLGGSESLRLSNVAVRDPRAPSGHVWKTNLPEREVTKYVDLLEQVFPGSRAAYAGKHVFACWSTYPYVKGCYTCPRPGQWNDVLPHVGEPIGDVYFAGEHCSADFQGFMNGAAQTGRQAAEQIVARLKK